MKSYKKNKKFVFLNITGENKQKLTKLLNNRDLFDQFVKNYNEKKYYKSFLQNKNDPNEIWYLCLTGYVDSKKNGINHELGLTAYKKVDDTEKLKKYKEKNNKKKIKKKIKNNKKKIKKK
jgi:hypothetical protein